MGGQPNTIVKQYVTVWNSESPGGFPDNHPGSNLRMPGGWGNNSKPQSSSKSPTSWVNDQVVTLEGYDDPFKAGSTGYKVKIDSEIIYWSVDDSDWKKVPLSKIDEPEQQKMFP